MDDFLILVLVCIIFTLLFCNNKKKVKFALKENYIPVSPSVIKLQTIPYQDRFTDFSNEKDIEKKNNYENNLNDIYYNSNEGDISELYDQLTNVPFR